MHEEKLTTPVVSAAKADDASMVAAMSEKKNGRFFKCRLNHHFQCGQPGRWILGEGSSKKGQDGGLGILGARGSHRQDRHRYRPVQNAPAASDS